MLHFSWKINHPVVYRPDNIGKRKGGILIEDATNNQEVVSWGGCRTGHRHYGGQQYAAAAGGPQTGRFLRCNHSRYRPFVRIRTLLPLRPLTERGCFDGRKAGFLVILLELLALSGCGGAGKRLSRDGRSDPASGRMCFFIRPEQIVLGCSPQPENCLQTWWRLRARP